MRELTYVLGDIHGRADRYHEILKLIGFSDEDVLYILGDVVDRNPDGIALLEEIMDAPNIHMLLGNHEYMMLNAVRDPERRLNGWYTTLDLWYYNGGEVTQNAYSRLNWKEQRRILEYLESLPLDIPLRIGDRKYLLVHASPVSMYTPDDTQYENETEFAVWNRLDPQVDRFDPDTVLICGHTPTIHLHYAVPMEVYREKNMIFIDCGCAYSASQGGRLACICLETGKIRYSTLR